MESYRHTFECYPKDYKQDEPINVNAGKGCAAVCIGAVMFWAGGTYAIYWFMTSGF